MTWIIVLLLTGVVLIFIELFFIPGITVVGALGVVLSGIGVVLAYREFGSTTGSIILAACILSIIAIIVLGAKSNFWQKLSHKGAIESKANVIEPNELKVGDTGISISAIKPMGKARINSNNYEVRSNGEYIAEDSEIEIIRLTGNQVTVKKKLDS